MEYYLVNTDTGYIVGCNESGALIAREWLQGDLNNSSDRLSESDLQFLAAIKQRGFNHSNLRVIPECYSNGTPSILSAQLNLTWECNLKCFHCYVDDHSLMAPQLSFQEWLTVIDELRIMNVPRIAFLGGEPLLYQHFFELAYYARKQGFKILMSTNATLLTEEIAKSIRDVGFNEVDVSLDGGMAETHENLRGKGTFANVLRGIKYLVQTGLKVKTATVLHKDNFREIKEIAFLAKSLGVEHCFLNNLVPGGNAKNLWNSMHLSTKEIEEVRKFVQDWNKRHTRPKLFMELHFMFENLQPHIRNIPKTYAGCKAGRREILIRPDGFVAPCPLFLTERKMLNSDIRKESIKYIWEQDIWIHQFRNVNEFTIKGKCVTCEFKNMCKGGCHAAAYFRFGDLHMPDPRCPY